MTHGTGNNRQPIGRTTAAEEVRDDRRGAPARRADDAAVRVSVELPLIEQHLYALPGDTEHRVRDGSGDRLGVIAAETRRTDAAECCPPPFVRRIGEWEQRHRRWRR